MMTIKHNGITRPVPENFISYEVVLNPMSKTAERNGNGRLVRETLPDKWSINVEWKFQTPEQYYDWFKYLKGLTRVDFFVTFPAPTGSMETAEFYLSPVTATMLNLSRGSTGWWQTLKCSFVEV